jgi:hypothetical protein
MMSWTHIDFNAKTQNDDPMTEDLLGDIWNNQEEALSLPFSFSFEQTPGHSEETWTEMISMQLIVPPMLALSPSTWELYLPYHVRRAFGSDIFDIRHRWNGGSWTEFLNIDPTGENWHPLSLTISDADLKIAALQDSVYVDIEGQVDSIWFIYASGMVDSEAKLRRTA